jgi:fatty-acyl-CoA synthase
MNLSEWITKHAGFTPDKPAIRFEGEEISYAALAARIEAAAWALKHELGVLPGDRVAHLGLNSPEMLILLFACARMGAVFTPMNWRLAPPEHAFILGHSGASVLIADSEFVGHVEEIGTIVQDMPLASIGAPPAGWQEWNVLVDSAQSRDPAEGAYDDPVLLVYTSGTTGRPKGALLTQSNLFWNAVNSTHMHDLTGNDHVLTTIPLFHVGGMNIQTLPCLHAGGTVTLHARFDPAETLSAIAEDRPSLTVLVPAQMSALMSLPDWDKADLSALRFVTTGSMIVPVPLIEKFHERGLPMVQVYGSTETAPVVVYQTRADAERKLGSTGRAGLHSEIRLVDKQYKDVPAGTRGEILVRGPQVMREYWGDPQATAEALRDGWYYSGDIGHLDEEGWLYVDERKKDVIISGGENIYPAELEAVLAECEAIAEAAVVARADEQWGEIPVATIVLREAGAMDREAVLALFEGRIARFKHPKDALFMESLPRNAMGKIEKYRLRELLAEAGERLPT